jgi:tRNA(Ile)-lysidine synthase
MIKRFEKYYNNESLFSKTDRILLAVSGGRDSVAMVYLFHQAKLHFGIAHCNFKLRGKESDKDEQFVCDLAKKLKVPFYTTSFDTKTYVKKNKLSTQMAARELRYKWFAEIKEKNKFHYIATAHHKNDVAETLLINLTKGTGLSGLHGIKSKVGDVIRPLLCFNRTEIDNFIEENKLPFREDQSNAETKYVRNKIRHKIIPELEKINPSFVETIFNETQHFEQLEQLLESKINEDKKTCWKTLNDGTIEIEIDKLLNLRPLRTYLYYFLNPYGFNADDVVDVINSLNKQSGKQFYSSTHQLIKDRTKLILTTIQTNDKEEYTIEKMEDFNTLPFVLNVKLFSKEKFKTIKKNKKVAYLNADKIKYPLVVRNWKTGDKFKPFGMKGTKKLSDFFVDEKFSLVEKEITWILASTNKIIWVVGHRIDEDFRISEKTETILQLSVQ